MPAQLRGTFFEKGPGEDRRKRKEKGRKDLGQKGGRRPRRNLPRAFWNLENQTLDN